MGNFVTSTPNEAALVSGPRGTRIAVGNTVFRFWVIEQVKRISLEMHTLDLHSQGAETVAGVRVSVTATAQVKIHARVEGKIATSGPEKGVDVLDKRTILLAAQHFLKYNDREADLKQALRQTLEGHQRQILGTLTVEQIYKDRAAFSAKVREHVHEELAHMGFEVVSYSVVSITDENGYMDALGATQTALVKREAAEGMAKNQAEAKVKVAQAEAHSEQEAAKAMRQAHVVRNDQKLAEAESDQTLELKKADIAIRTGEARERADAAAKIEKAKQEQEVVRQRTTQKLIETEVETRIAEQEAARIKLEMQGEAQAKLSAQEANAKAVIVLAEAEANRIRLLAQAEADAIRMKGEAEAANLRLQAEAYAQFGDAAISVMIINRLPEIASEICKPLAKTEKMVFVSAGGGGEGGGGGPSAFTRDITGILGHLPAAVEALTGFDLREALNRTKRSKHGTLALSHSAMMPVAVSEDQAL